MSVTGSLMIRNLRKKSDYDKAVITQNELLNISASNIANIANARKEFQQGILPQALPQTKKTPVELQADLGLQQSTAIQNLSQLFKYPEISSILGGLTNDEVFIINQSFPSIKKDIESKFNTDLVTPSFFVDYIKKYILELNESKGVSTNLSNMTNKFNQLTTDIRDIQLYLPDNRLLRQLVVDLNTLGLPRIQIQPVMERLQELENLMLDKSDFQALEEKGDVDRDMLLNRLQTITADMPTQTDLQLLHQNIINNSLPKDVILQQLETLVNSITDRQQQQMKILRSDIKEPTSSQSRIRRSLKVSKVNIMKKNQVLEVIDNPRLLPPDDNLNQISIVREVGKNNKYNEKLSLYFTYNNGNNRRVSNAELKNMYDYPNKLFRSWVRTSLNINTVPTITNMIDYIGEYGYETKKVSVEGEISTSDIMKGIDPNLPPYIDLSASRRSRAESQTDPTTQPLAEASNLTEGFGLPIYNGARPKKVVKIGKGVDINKEPLYKTFGKFIVSIPNLVNRDVLQFKYPSLSRIPNLEPVSVSEDFREFFIDTLDNGKVNYKIFKTLDEEEKRLFEKVSEKAGLFKSFGLTKQPDKEDEEEVKRFNILRGEYYAGNNSHQLLDELRILIIKFINKGRIGKNEGISILNSLVA